MYIQRGLEAYFRVLQGKIRPSPHAGPCHTVQEARGCKLTRKLLRAGWRMPNAGRSLACCAGRGRDGACQTPSYWSTRNGSFGTGHPAFTNGSALPVLTLIGLTKLPVACCRFCGPVGRLSIDRFLVFQYVGKRQMPNRACFAKSVDLAPTRSATVR